MSSNSRNDSPQPTQALHSLCSEHLQREATLLAAVLRVVRAMEAGFRQRSGQDFLATVCGHAEVAGLMEELNRRRAQFRASAARLLGTCSEAITVPVALASLPTDQRSVLEPELGRVRGLAEELAALNGRVAVYLRIHLDAYQRILRDLTNSRRNSGRYGPTGNAESHEYRPLIQIHG